MSISHSICEEAKVITIARLGRAALAATALALACSMFDGPGAHANGDRDSLFVGDGLNNNVKVFDARTGAILRSLPTGSSTPPVVGPRGMVLRLGDLFLVNQNVNTPFNGEVL